MKKYAVCVFMISSMLFAGDTEDVQLIALIKNNGDKKNEQEIIEEAKLLIKKGANVNTKTKTEENKDWTPLHYAANKGYFDVVTFLMEGTSPTADPNAVDKSNKTPLLFAVQYADPTDKNYDNRKEIIKYLLKKGSSPNLGNKYDEKPLYIAARSCAVDVVRILLNNAADIRAISGVDLLKLIVDKGCMPLLDIMLEHFGDKDFTQAIQDLEKNEYSTIVHLMTKKINSNEFAKYLQLLLDHGADINKKDKTWMESPLANTFTRSNLDYALTLLKTKRSININDQENSFVLDQTPLMLLFQNNALFDKETDDRLAEVIELMVAQGARLDLKDVFDKTVVEFAQEQLSGQYSKKNLPKVRTIVARWAKSAGQTVTDLANAFLSIG